MSTEEEKLLSTEDAKVEKSVLDRDHSRAFDLDWKEPPSVADLKADYEAALPIHTDHITAVDHWLELMDGRLNVDVGKGRSKIQPKLIRKQAEWRYSALSEPFLSTHDLFEASPVTYEDKASAEQNQLVLNHQINNRIDKVAFIDEYVRTAVDEGTVIVKIGWEYEEEIVEEEVPIIENIPITDPALAQQMAQQGQPPVQEKIVGYELEEKVKVKANHPTLEICEYNNTIIDPTCKGDLDKAKFVIHSYTTSLDILKADGRYKNLDIVNVSNAGPLSYSDSAFKDEDNLSFEFKDEARKKLVMHEYWGYWDVEGEGKLTPILACYIGDVLVRLEENPYPDQKLPFVAVQYLPVRKSIYGEPDSVLIEDNQKIIGAITRGMIDLMGRSANSQQGIRKDALDVANRRKFEEGKDYQFNANVDPRQAIYMHQYPEIPASAMNLIGLQNSEAESITGVKAFHSGLSGEALGSTATGIRSTLDATSKRELGILRRLADGIIQIGRKFIALNSEFLDEEEVVRITNDEFVTVRRDDLDGSIDLKLSISTAEADNEKAQELAFMLQTLGNNVDPSMTMMILSDIAKLRKMPELAKRIEEFKPEPDPIAQEKAQLELQLLRAQIANEEGKASEGQADTQWKLAKARKTASEADIDDLNYLEEAQGVKHQRDLQKEGFKSQQKIDEKAAEKLLEFQKEKAMGSDRPV